MSFDEFPPEQYFQPEDNKRCFVYSKDLKKLKETICRNLTSNVKKDIYSNISSQ